MTYISRGGIVRICSSAQKRANNPQKDQWRLLAFDEKTYFDKAPNVSSASAINTNYCKNKACFQQVQ